MADDLIAQLYPVKEVGGHIYARKVIQNSSRCVRPSRESHHQEEDLFASHETREPTMSREATPENVPRSELTELPYLELRFSHGPRTPSGFVFGTDENCDIVLPSAKKLGLSRQHFALTYKRFADGYFRLILRDIGSSYGTTVTYDSHGAKVRTHFHWVLHGFDVPKKIRVLVVKLRTNLQFQIVIAP